MVLRCNGKIKWQRHVSNMLSLPFLSNFSFLSFFQHFLLHCKALAPSILGCAHRGTRHDLARGIHRFLLLP